jgi:hypothetical protein
VEQVGRLRKLDQDVRVGRGPPSYVSALVGDGSIEFRHAAADILQARPQRLERGAVSHLHRGEPFERLGGERRTGISRGVLYDPLQRIANSSAASIAVAITRSVLFIVRPPR